MDAKRTNAGMQWQVEFLAHVIDEVQQTNRFLDTKASILVALESSLLVMLASFLFDAGRLQVVQAFLLQIPRWCIVLLLIYSVLWIAALLVQIVFTLRTLIPMESPDRHVDVSGYRPRGLFFLYNLDRNGRMIPSVTEYSFQLSQMSKEDIVNEYVFELEKLSYIRKTKGDLLARSFRVLGGLIVGITVLGLLLFVGTLV